MTAAGNATTTMTRRRTIVIGITGPIGCGKSTVAGWLARRGARVVDADVVAREVTAPGTPGHDAVLAAFGGAVSAADGTLDRAALAKVVFDDPVALQRLEAVVHPLVRPRIAAAIEAARAASAPAVAIEAIKLVEGGLGEQCDVIWWVTCRDQRDRLIGRGMAADDADRRIAAQVGMTERVRARAASMIIADTTGSPAEAERRIEGLWRAAVG